jgi:hypothetical protein
MYILSSHGDDAPTTPNATCQNVHEPGRALSASALISQLSRLCCIALHGSFLVSSRFCSADRLTPVAEIITTDRAQDQYQRGCVRFLAMTGIARLFWAFFFSFLRTRSSCGRPADGCLL